ncbi:MAG: alpha-amylase family glycosyl hydrolase [Calditrichia bacterium]
MNDTKTAVFLKAMLLSSTTIGLTSGEHTEIKIEDVKLTPTVALKSCVKDGTNWLVTTADALQIDQSYTISIGPLTLPVLIGDSLNHLYSKKPLGYTRGKAGSIFRVFAPRASRVHLVIFNRFDDLKGRELEMRRDKDGVWELETTADWTGKFYGYRIHGPQGAIEKFDSSVIIADPYSKAVVSQNHYLHPAKTHILPDDDFDWEGDTGVSIHERDLIIYEAHVRDMTMHPSSGLHSKRRGSYLGLINENQRGGLPWMRQLGINAVELLPVQGFGTFEIPYKEQTGEAYNTWNPYARNHWGYMTNYFFAPEAFYSSGGKKDAGEWNGADARQVKEFKTLVKEFHRNDIAVIMDVVYNHVSQYDLNPFKYLDKQYYFRTDAKGEFWNDSGCGNDFKSESPMARRMIIDSILYWMKEYHIDGFRFDLAKIIDWETCEAIIAAAREENPNVIIIAEPWGGGYDPAGFSNRGWAAWNDKIRNGIKGWDPEHSKGFLFGEWQGDNNLESLRSFAMGTLQKHGGLFAKTEHAVNYLASHDNHTLGDFIRIGLGEVNANKPIDDLQKHALLSPAQLRLNKLAALTLFSAQGPLMIHAGQEFARSKVIASTTVPDTNVGLIDHNSYEKDDETNWLNFDHAEANSQLVDYYRGLILLRKRLRALRWADPEHFYFANTSDPLLLVYLINYNNEEILVALNGNPNQVHDVELPAGDWAVWVDAKAVYADKPAARLTGKLTIAPSSGCLLAKQ